MTVAIDNPNTVSYSAVSDFRSGMNRAEDPAKLQEGEYAFLINGRTRFGNIETIFEPVIVESGLPTNSIKLQGIYAAGSILLILVDGRAYYRDFNPGNSSRFKQVPNIRLSPDVDFIHAIAVPNSTLNYTRTADQTSPQTSISLTSIGAKSPQCVILQDGESQPQLIFSNGDGRPAKTFQQWNVDDREYVPIGKQMLYEPSNGKTYIVSPDGLELYDSVSGRPLDFVKAVDIDGNKLNDAAFSVEASRLSYAFDFDPITALNRINSQQGEFFSSTLKNSYIIVPRLEGPLLYGEPSFGNIPVAPTGAINTISLADILGDSAFIDISGITSFNAVQQFQVEGNNSPFSQSVAPFFKGVTQDITAAIAFDNYGLFAVKTVFGYGVLIYDNTRQKFIGLDQYTVGMEDGAVPIKQFAEIKLSNGTRKLFFAAGNRIYEAFASASAVSPLQVYPKNWSTFTGAYEQTLIRSYITVQKIAADGTITATNYLNNRKTSILTQSVTANWNSNLISTKPFGDSVEDSIRTFTFTHTTAKRKSYSVGVLVEINFPCEILSIGVALDPKKAVADLKQASGYYG